MFFSKVYHVAKAIFPALKHPVNQSHWSILYLGFLLFFVPTRTYTVKREFKVPHLVEKIRPRVSSRVFVFSAPIRFS
jgi:hypothetical protein